MHIRYGFDIALNLAQPTTILTMMDVHFDLRRAIAGENEFKVSPPIPATKIVDRHGTVTRLLSAQGGSLSTRLEGVGRSDGREDETDATADAWAVSDLPPEALPFLRA